MELLRFNHLACQPRLTHAVTTRNGGISAPPFHTLNLAFHVSDDPAKVIENHRLLGSHLGYDPEKLFRMDQVHGDRIVRIDADSDPRDIPACDAMMTDVLHTPLMVMVADCIPALFYDPEHHAIAVAHAGRNGVFLHILSKTVRAMQEAYGTDPEKLLAGLGPSIGGCCYEVGENLAAEAERLGFGDMVIRKEGRIFLDNVAMALEDLNQCKVKKIEVMDACTACGALPLYSYRAEGGKTGRFAGVVMLG